MNSPQDKNINVKARKMDGSAPAFESDSEDLAAKPSPPGPHQDILSDEGALKVLNSVLYSLALHDVSIFIN